jgi:hypothetical protein
LITTRFIVEPQGLPDCTLRLPEGQQLVAVHLAGLPALTHKMNQNDWRVALGPPQLPAIVEVTTRSSERDKSRGRLEINRPGLLDGIEPIPVEINLWSVGYPSTMPRPTIGVTAESTVGEQALLRFDQLLSIAESANAQAFQLSAPDGYNWYRPWSAMLIRLRREAVDALANPDSRGAPSQISRPFEEQLAASSARLEAWMEQCTANLAQPVAHEADVDSSGREPVTDSPSSIERWVYCVTDGALDRLTLDDGPKYGGGRQSSLIGVLAIAALSLGAVILTRWTRALELIYQWPHAVGFLIGTACWAWLQPSWCGLVIAAACSALALRSGWPGRPIGLDASTVLRASRPR